MRKKTITINWSNKIPITDYEKFHDADKNGVYMITRVWGAYSGNEHPEKVLYIGKTFRTFSQRIAEHQAYWIPELRGKIFVRFGTISPNTYDNKLLEDIESVLIYHEQPEENTSKRNGYTFQSDYLPYIINKGIKLPIDKEIDGREQLDKESL